MIITKKEVNRRVDELYKTNWKVKRLIEAAGSFNKLSKNIKDLIYKELKITVTKKQITVFSDDKVNKPTDRNTLLDFED